MTRASLLGRLRHAAEERLWARPAWARRLLRGDLMAIAEQLAAAPQPLHAAERSRWSQNGEDGVIAELMERLGVDRGTFAEIAAADGEQNCTRALAEAGWSGVWVEGDPALAAHAAALPVAAGLVVVERFVDRTNVVDLLRDAGLGQRFDLLSLDVDGNDYWLLDRILGAFEPRVLVCEYNGAHRFDWVLPYDPAHRWDESWRYGASLPALARLAAAHGYALVGCDSTGTNAFFVRAAELPAGLRALPASEAYVAPHHRPGSLGHPRHPPDDGTAMSPLDAAMLERIAIRRTRLIGPTAAPGGTACVLADLHNDTPVALTSSGEHPVYVVARVLDASGVAVTEAEPRRCPLAAPVPPRGWRPVGIEVELPAATGRYRVVPTVVQEHVAWRPVVVGEGIWVDVP